LREKARLVPEHNLMSDSERSTKAVKLSDDRWTDLGRGPAIVGAYGSEILFAAGDVEPAVDDIGLVLRFDASPLPVQAQTRLWAKACFGGRNTRAVVLPLDLASGVSPVSSKNFR
jgi:hypothetical protein